MPAPQVANRALRIRCEVRPESRAGVILAQGGRQHGYALHLEEGRPVFSIRIGGQLFSTAAAEAPAGRFSLEARLDRDGTMRLLVQGREVARARASGLIPTQPQDELSIGEDTRTAVGDYPAPHPLKGTVENVKVTTE
jgi:arylsulfatase